MCPMGLLLLSVNIDVVKSSVLDDTFVIRETNLEFVDNYFNSPYSCFQDS